MKPVPAFSTFQYSLLHYRHALLDEVLTVGVLVLFPEQGRVCFLHPARLARLKHTYRNAPEKTLKAYFRSFVQRAEQLNQSPELFASFFQDQEGFIFREFLPADGSTLQFGLLKSSVQYTGDTNLICEHLREQYLSFYEPLEERPRIDDQDLKINYRTRVKQLLLSVETPKPFRDGYSIRPDGDPIKPEQPKTSGVYRFDFGWQNHALHLVKPVSFDIQHGKNIEEKAHTNLGQFSVLEDYATRKNIVFDLLVAPPQDKTLFSYYDYALKLLQRPKSVRLIQVDDLEKYAQQTVKALTEPDEPTYKAA